jgi:cation diffusion facilitator CzcD-associated flavoprotein CzcO
MCPCRTSPILLRLRQVGLCWLADPEQRLQQFWPNQWAGGAIIHKYFKQVAIDYGIDKKTRLNTEFLSAEWRETTNRWHYSAKDLKTGNVFRGSCKILVAAIGALTLPKVVSIPGKDEFEGKIMHTGAWVEGTDLTGLNVVVLGNGCS